LVARKAGVCNAYVTPNLAWWATALRLQLEQCTLFPSAKRRHLVRQAQRASRAALRIARRFRNDLPQALRECAAIAALCGRSRRARRLLDESLAISLLQDARYEHAQSLIWRGRIGQEFGWPTAEADLAEGRAELVALQIPWPAGEPSEAPRESTLSLADRFDTVLKAGRDIAAALSPTAIYLEMQRAAARLLRAEHCQVLHVESRDGQYHVRGMTKEAEPAFQLSSIRHAL
jgi:two-component system sensor kinase